MSDPDQMTVSFRGGKKVVASFGDFEVATDQSVKNGGEASAPEPYAVFLASLAACAGVYVVGFCQKRNIPTDGVSLIQTPRRDKDEKIVGIDIDIRVPADFPEKYHGALVRVANKCAVKKTIENPPEFRVQTVVVD